LPRSKSRAPTDSRADAPHLLRRVPWIPVGVSLAVLITAAFVVDPVRDAATLESVGEAHLALPSSYLAIAPFSAILDTLTLLTVGQHIALLLWGIGLFAIVRVRRAQRISTTPRREAVASGILLAAIFCTYAVAALVPRPMASLATTDGSVIVIDFHSHTQYSHDGRSGWSEDDVRAWHRAAGFDVAYVTDHATYEGAERGIAGNPAEAGEGTMLLQGLEAFYKGEHVNVLGAGRRYKGLTDSTLKDVDPEALALASILRATSPVLIETVPGKLGVVPSIADSPTNVGVSAIEIVDGSPRGLSQTRKERARIVALADSLNLALVTGSDNHGYGHAAPGWTLLRLSGWRGMRTDSLSAQIEQVLRIGRRQATRSVERRVAGGANPLSLLLAAPVIAWRMLTTLSPDERVLWLLWTWALVFVARGARRMRLRPSATE
jgi:hypothetical protein